jgi:hypothetical protein
LFEFLGRMGWMMRRSATVHIELNAFYMMDLKFSSHLY